MACRSPTPRDGGRTSDDWTTESHGTPATSGRAVGGTRADGRRAGDAATPLVRVLARADHGCKLLLPDDAWFLFRPSGTEPLMRCYAEGDSPARVDALLEAGRDLVLRPVTGLPAG